MDIAELGFDALGVVSLLIIIVIYFRGPWYKKPIGRFLITLFIGLAIVYVGPFISISKGQHATIISLTFSIVFGILLAYGVYAFYKASNATVNAQVIDQWES